MAKKGSAIRIEIPAGLQLSQEQIDALKGVIKVQVVGYRGVRGGEREPPLPETNIIIQQSPRRRTSKKGSYGGTKKAAVKSTKK